MPKVELLNGSLVITIPVSDPPKPSATGKSLVLASTHGNLTTACLFKGKPIVLGMTAYVKP